MATQNARKRKSDEMDNGPSTPTAGPVKKMRITQSQKQALIDNLQLEITERARQLRAHYALQCHDLRSRIERRINRVPISLRKMKMGELMAQHEASQNNATAPPAQSIAQSILRSPAKPQFDDRPLPALPSPSKLPSPIRQPTVQPQKSRKRKSSAILIPSDKENHEPDTSNTALESLPVQKNTKRAKTATTTASTAPKRTTSRTTKKLTKNKDNPSGVLSPRSHNSRTLPRSPIKDKELPPPVPSVPPISPLRHQQPTQLPQSPQRPLSPVKPQSPFKIAASAAGSAISAFAKRGYAAAGAAGARLTRPLSREKEVDTLSGLGTTIPAPASPTGRMLPPPRPVLATLTSTSATAMPTLSPQRTASQASMRSNASEQSSTSTKTDGTVVTKSTRAATSKKTAAVNTTTAKKTTTVVASKSKNKVVVSGSTTSTLSPKAAGVKKTSTTTAAAKKAAAAAGKKMAAAAAPAPTGRVLRKRN